MSPVFGLISNQVKLNVISIAGNLKQDANNFCVIEKTELDNFTCPNPDSFDVLVEFEKPDSEWKLDFAVCLCF